MKDAGDPTGNIFFKVTPLQRKETILKTLEILTLDLFSKSCKIIRTPEQKFLGGGPSLTLYLNGKIN